MSFSDDLFQPKSNTFPQLRSARGLPQGGVGQFRTAHHGEAAVAIAAQPGDAANFQPVGMISIWSKSSGSPPLAASLDLSVWRWFKCSRSEVLSVVALSFFTFWLEIRDT